MKSIHVLVVSVLVSLFTSIGWGAAIVRFDTHATMHAAACAHPAQALVRRELVFGTARAHASPLGEDEWQSFLDTVVTPRFPDGFTVLNAAGQWRGEDGLTREQSRILVIWHDRSSRHDADIEAIRTAYKARFAQESVLRVDGISCVAF